MSKRPYRGSARTWPDLSLTAQSLFSALHGIIALGVDQKISPMRLPRLREQLATLVTAMAVGLPVLAPR